MPLPVHPHAAPCRLFLREDLTDVPKTTAAPATAGSLLGMRYSVFTNGLPPSAHNSSSARRGTTPRCRLAAACLQFYGITKVGAAAASVAVTAHRHCCGNERERLQEQEQQEQQRSSSSSVLVPLDTRQPTWCMEHRLQELKTSYSNLADKQAHMGLAASAD